jgi:hypothetical protein
VVEHLSFQHGTWTRTTGYHLGGALVSGESTAAVSPLKVRSAPEGMTVIRHMPTATPVANVVNFTRHLNKLCSLPVNRREPRCQSSVHVAHGREGLRLNAEAPAIFVIDDDETIGAADWDFTANQDINGTTAEIRCAPRPKTHSQLFPGYYS